jgi:hypothetical protein
MTEAAARPALLGHRLTSHGVEERLLLPRLHLVNTWLVQAYLRRPRLRSSFANNMHLLLSRLRAMPLLKQMLRPYQRDSSPISMTWEVSL